MKSYLLLLLFLSFFIHLDAQDTIHNHDQPELNENMVQNNLFEYAITNNELLEFGMGEGKYFIVDREYGEHWILGAWQMHILPYYSNRGTTITQKYISEMLEIIMNSSKIKASKKVSAILYHIHVMYSTKKRQKLDTTFSIGHTENLIVKFVKEHLSTLHQHKDSTQIQGINNAINLIKDRGGFKEYQERVLESNLQKTYFNSMKDCGVEKFDTINNSLEKDINQIITDYQLGKTEGLKTKAENAKKDLYNFRMQLAYNRATEALEANFGWTPIFDEMDKKLEFIINKL